MLCGALYRTRKIEHKTMKMHLRVCVCVCVQGTASHVERSFPRKTHQQHRAILQIWTVLVCEGAKSKYLFWFEAWWDPGVLLQGAARVVVRGGVPLEVVHELGDRLLHLDRHGCHCMLLPTTLAVHTDLPGRDKETRGTGQVPTSAEGHPRMNEGY